MSHGTCVKMISLVGMGQVYDSYGKEIGNFGIKSSVFSSQCIATLTHNVISEYDNSAADVSSGFK